MNLRDMVKSFSADAATATVATHEGKNAANVANVANVAGVAIADAQNEILRLTKRWQWYLSLATAHGIHPDVVGAEYPTEQDRLDVVEPPEHTDELLRRCMATQCRNVRVRQRQADYLAGSWVPQEVSL